MFTVLAPTKLYRPSTFPPAPIGRLLTTEATRLAARWVRMIGQESIETCYFSGHSTVYRSLPARIGRDAILDAAATYTVDCHDAFMSGSDFHEKSAHASGIKAMQSMRSALASSEQQTDSVLIATMCLKTSEYIRGIYTYNFQYHALATARILKARWRAGCWGGLERHLLWTCLVEEILEAIHTGTMSELDDSSRVEASKHPSLQDPGDLDSAFGLLAEQLIRVPRLACLLRHVSSGSGPSVVVATLEAAKLARDVYKHVCDSAKLLVGLNYMATDSEHCPSTDTPLSTYIDYPSVQAFTLAIIQSMAQMLICGIILRLLDQSPISLAHLFDAVKVQEEETQAASTIVMSLEYAFRPRPAPPWMLLRIMTPLTLACASWERLERKLQVSASGAPCPAAHATRMRIVCTQMLENIIVQWRTSGGDMLDYAKRLSEASLGGPLMLWMSRGGNRYTEYI
ncbi:hypothetical protein LTR97_012360 [Elasticomyces elasticus]|uniref:Transcription factor domain-containing protein n=1 Tax=Elasticomyces elasticus TaxID=574655 RepID=A0AAN7ZYY5_9PEZI|nr:hypothetical protein LTR97_012360 [Elasticomyces elasticus]